MDASEMIEIEMLESKIRRLNTQNQSLLEETERLRSAVDLQEKAQSKLQSEFHLLQSKKESMETKFSKIVLDQAMQIQELKDKVEGVAGERDGLRSELDVRSEEAEKLFLDSQDLERTLLEEQMELRKVMAERARLLEEKERWDDRVDKITEDNTVIILTLLTSQSDLEEQMNRKDAMLEAFAKKVLEMVRRTRAIVDYRQVPAGGDDGETSPEKDDDEIGNVVMVMAAPVEQELKLIEAAVASAASRKEKVEKAVKANTAAASAAAWKEMVGKAAKADAAAPSRKEKVMEEEAEEEFQTMVTRRPTEKVAEAWWPKMEDTGSRKGRSSKGSSRQKGKAEWPEWAQWDD